jgi:NADH:ubiquinone oxidoreductase subunit 6 (subunit J)
MISVLVIVWAVAVVLDMVTTMLGFERGFREKNRVLRWVWDKMGEGGMWLAFMVLGAIVVICIMGLYDWRPWAGCLFGVAAIAWRGVVIYKNFRLIRGKK